MSLILEARQLTVQRGKHVLYRGFNCMLYKGECVWLRGRNGEGKTSLMLTLCGLLPAESGRIFWQNQELAASHAKLHYLWYYCPHQPALKNVWTVNENLQAALKLVGQKMTHSDIRSVTRHWGVEHLLFRPAHYLSQGQRRRVALARLNLLPFRPVWLMDEPFDALDAEAQNLLVRMMEKHIQHNGSILMTSHFQPPSNLNIHREIHLLGEK